MNRENESTLKTMVNYGTKESFGKTKMIPHSKRNISGGLVGLIKLKTGSEVRNLF
jgi:hypothetical protein